MIRITSVANPLIKKWTALKMAKGRKESGRFLVEEKHLIEEAKKAGILETLIVLDGQSSLNHTDMVVVSDNVMKKLSFTKSLPSYMAVCTISEPELVNPDKIVVLNQLQDPGNIGTIIRTALAFGYDGVVLSLDCVDLYNDKLLRASQGALFHLPVIQRDLGVYLAQIKKQGMSVIGSFVKQAVPLSKFVFPKRFALVVGNEGSGISESIGELCDERVTIEMAHFESLNVNVATAILLYAGKTA